MQHKIAKCCNFSHLTCDWNVLWHELWPKMCVAMAKCWIKKYRRFWFKLKFSVELNTRPFHSMVIDCIQLHCSKSNKWWCIVSKNSGPVPYKGLKRKGQQCTFCGRLFPCQRMYFVWNSFFGFNVSQLSWCCRSFWMFSFRHRNL